MEAGIGMCGKTVAVAADAMAVSDPIVAAVAVAAAAVVVVGFLEGSSGEAKPTVRLLLFLDNSEFIFLPIAPPRDGRFGSSVLALFTANNGFGLLREL